MTERLKEIKRRIDEGETGPAVDELNRLLDGNAENPDDIYYLLGNAFRTGKAH